MRTAGASVGASWLSTCASRAKTTTAASGAAGAPARGQRAAEVEPEPARLADALQAGVRQEALAGVDPLDADLGFPCGAHLDRRRRAAVADGVRHDLRDEQPQRLDLPVRKPRT